MNRDIPGFYYDEVKKKYFKIEKNHVAVPAGAEYSADAVKRRKLDENAAKELDHLSKLEKGRVRRSLTDPLIGGALLREHGTSNNYSNSAIQAYVQHWEGKQILPAKISMGRYLSLVAHIQVLTETTETFRAFDWDPVSRMLFLPRNGSTFSAIAESSPPTTFGVEYGEFWYPRSGVVPICHLDGLVNSISFDPTTRLLLATWQDAVGSNVHTVQMSASKGRDDCLNGYHDSFATQSSWVIPAPQALTTHMYDNGITLWASTAAPAASPYSFAVGTSCGIVTFNKDASRLNWLQSEEQRRDRNCEFFAVEFLSQNPSILLAGKRNGDVNLMDLRLPQAGYASGNAGVFHPGSVAHVKQVNEHQIVVSGLESTLCQYDLRFCSVDDRLNSSKPSNKKNPAPGRTLTKPLFEYASHQNLEHRDAGFAVDTDAGLVAAAQVGGLDVVKVFSTKTGEEITTLDATKVGGSIDYFYVKAMRFLADRDDKGMKSLWVAKGTKIVRYAW